MVKNESIKKYGCNKFRVNLHFDYSKGFVRHCCLHPWFTSENIKVASPLYQKIGSDMLAGLANQNCNFCYQREAQGLTSLRLEHSNHLEGLEQIDLQATQLAPEIFEISISNLCNLQCAYCRSEFSSVWENEDLANKKLSPNPEKNADELQIQKKQFWDLFYLSPVKHVRLIGGEPFLNKEFYQIIDKVIQHERADKIIITIVSNLNFSENHLDKFINYIPVIAQKCEVRLLASMESTAETAEFIRYGLSWETYQKNFNKLYALDLPKFTFGTRLTLNILCVRSMQNYLKYLVELPRAKGRKKLFECGNLVYPAYLQMSLLSEGLRHYLKDCFQYQVELNKIFL
ncbi:MAG: radical SAM protein [Pseudobdellovibrio sp.]